MTTFPHVKIPPYLQSTDPSKNTGSKTLHTPLHTFPIFGPPTFGFWFQSAHEVTTRLKMSAGGFQVL